MGMTNPKDNEINATHAKTKGSFVWSFRILFPSTASGDTCLALIVLSLKSE
jgi:hypothetical protein